MTTLRGRCACGRNQYAVNVPKESDELAQVVYSNSSHSRRLQAAPLIAFLKVPVSWFESSTVAYYPDETHQTIRKTFYSPSQENLQNQFCGFCGTQISQFNSASREQDSYIWVTIGSLADEDLDLLEELGCLDLDEEQIEAHESDMGDAMDKREKKNTLFRAAQGVGHRGAPWFETMVESTQLGRIKRQRGGQSSADGSTSIGWEVVEFTSKDDEDTTQVVKRKVDDMET